MAATETEEAPLEGAARELAYPIYGGTQLEAPEIGLADGSANLVDRGNATKVLDRAGGCRDRDALAKRSRCPGQRRGTVQVDFPSRPPAGGGANGDVHRPRLRLEQAPEFRGAAVAQSGSRPACEHRCHPSSLTADRGVAHRIHTMVEPVQPPGGDPPRDGVLAQPGGTKLPDRNDSMLARCDLSHPDIRLNLRSGEKVADTAT
jgi:hypothetical protein